MLPNLLEPLVVTNSTQMNAVANVLFDWGCLSDWS
jgi:hypothetical protein